MRLRSRPQTRVVWSSSAHRVARRGVQEVTRPTRGGRVRWWGRTTMLLTIIGALRLARIVRAYPRPSLSLAGTAITLAGVPGPGPPVRGAGFVVLFRALFLPPDPPSAPAQPCSARLWAHPLISS